MLCNPVATLFQVLTSKESWASKGFYNSVIHVRICFYIYEKLRASQSCQVCSDCLACFLVLSCFVQEWGPPTNQNFTMVDQYFVNYWLVAIKNLFSDTRAHIIYIYISHIPNPTILCIAHIYIYIYIYIYLSILYPYWHIHIIMFGFIPLAHWDGHWWLLNCTYHTTFFPHIHKAAMDFMGPIILYHSISSYLYHEYVALWYHGFHGIWVPLLFGGPWVPWRNQAADWTSPTARRVHSRPRRERAPSSGRSGWEMWGFIHVSWNWMMGKFTGKPYIWW